MSEPARLKVPPHSVEAEQSVLGGLMLNQEAWDKIVGRVSTEDFYRTAHQIIFDVMGGLANASEPLDVVTISEALHRRSLADKAGGKRLPRGSLGVHPQRRQHRRLRRHRAGAIHPAPTDTRRQQHL